MKDVYLIAKRASQRTHNFTNCYLITLFYYLVDEKNYPLDFVPKQLQSSVKMLSRKLNRCSYLHYLTVIDMEGSSYVQAIRDETLLLKGLKGTWNQF